MESRLGLAFERDCLEDGMNHPAESILDDALNSEHAHDALSRLQALSLDGERASLSASTLRCLARRRPGTSSWRAGIVRRALSSDCVEIRDAAAQAADEWGGREIRDALKAHSEPVEWLRAYIDDILEDIEDEAGRDSGFEG